MGFRSVDYEIVGNILEKAEAWRLEAETVGFQFKFFRTEMNGMPMEFYYRGPDEVFEPYWEIA